LAGRKLGLRLRQFALLIDVNPFVTGGRNRGGKSKAESERATYEPTVALLIINSF
jgi:hypothetical protein